MRQHLVLMKGHPATGKSTLATALAQRLGWPLVDKDDVKDFLYELPGGNGLAYDIAWRIVERQLALGLSVVVDTPLSYPASYRTGCALAEHYATRLLVIETILDENRWRERLAARRLETSTHKISSWTDMQALLARYDGCWQYPIPPAHHVQVDTALPVDALVEPIVERLRSQTLGRETQRHSHP